MNTLVFSTTENHIHVDYEVMVCNEKHINVYKKNSNLISFTVSYLIYDQGDNFFLCRYFFTFYLSVKINVKPIWILQLLSALGVNTYIKPVL